MEQTMISGLDTSRVAVEARGPHELRHVPPAHPVESVDMPRKHAAPLVNPLTSVDPSGLVVVQYRNDSGEVRLQMPSESVVRAYRQRSTEADGASPEVTAVKDQPAKDHPEASRTPDPSTAGTPTAPAAVSTAPVPPPAARLPVKSENVAVNA